MLSQKDCVIPQILFSFRYHYILLIISDLHQMLHYSMTMRRLLRPIVSIFVCEKSHFSCELERCLRIPPAVLPEWD
jgi:hypothetical protein